MKLTYVSIANVSAQHIGEDSRIQDPDESSRVARIVKTAWEPTRQFILSEANWSFALRTVALTSRVDNPDWPIALGRIPYILPADMVRLAEIVDPDLDLDDRRYSIESGPNGQELLVDPCLVSATDPVTIRYVRDTAAIADPTGWPPAFVEAFAWRLAWEISDPLAADKGRKDRALMAAEKALSKARKVNNKTKAPIGNEETDWSRARLSGAPTRAPNT